MYIHVNIYVYIHIYICIYMCIYMYLYIYACTYREQPNLLSKPHAYLYQESMLCQRNSKKKHVRAFRND